MPKKTRKPKKDVMPEIPKELEVEVFASGPKDESFAKLGHLDLEFGREDLNQLRGKINEVIDFINKLN